MYNLYVDAVVLLAQRSVIIRHLIVHLLVIAQNKKMHGTGIKIIDRPARQQHTHTECICSHHTDRLHCNNKIILAHFIINRTIKH